MLDSVIDCRALYLDQVFRVRRIIDTSMPIEAVAFEICDMARDMHDAGVPACCLSWTGTPVDAF